MARPRSSRRPGSSAQRKTSTISRQAINPPAASRGRNDVPCYQQTTGGKSTPPLAASSDESEKRACPPLAALLGRTKGKNESASRHDAARSRHGPQPGESLRSASCRAGHGARRVARRPDPDALLSRPQSQRVGRERQSGHRFSVQPQSLPRLRARLRLLLRPPQPRVPELQRRSRLRAPHPGEGERRGAAERATALAALAAAGGRPLRQHRLLPAGRAQAASHPGLPRGVSRFPQSSGDHHQDRPW